jgi:hypothetical protein
MLHLMPGMVTGSRRKLFPPVAPRHLDEWLAADRTGRKHHSALYRVNKLWDQALESRLKCVVPDVSVFERTLPAGALVRS